MSQELAVRTITEDDMKTLEQAGVIPKDTPVAQLKVFAKTCSEHALSPFKGEIHLVRYKTKEGDKYTVIVGIDGFRNKAAKTKELAGTDAPKYNVRSDGSFETAGELIQAKRTPDTCLVTVYRIINGSRVSFSAEVVFNEFATRYQGQLTGKYASMPFQMIAKVAEAFALRKGFADEVSGLHIEEEQGAFEGATKVEIIPRSGKEELTPNHSKWDAAKKSLLNGYSVADIKSKYELSVENEALLIENTTTDVQNPG
jgi:phage recombination protein Bet